MTNQQESHTRVAATKVLDNVFGAVLALSFCVGAVMVLIQLVALVLGASTVVEMASNLLGPVAYAAAAGAGLLSLVGLYLHRWKTDE
ncbi:hypothetical protein WIS52_20110 [Pseudonocardia nematodicida]|uniref:Holin-X, holin superfamily III n=1 Tax=Pseudonocardia nematodicida TaxID=1206997 RepID=A0ABV1KFW7_9PSEU